MSRLTATERGSLVDVGLGLAKLHHGDSSAEANNRALGEVELALGLRGSEVVREWFVERPAVAQHFDEATPTFSTAAITRWLDGDYHDDWERVRTLLCKPAFRVQLTELSEHEQRTQVLEWLKLLADEGLGSVGYPKAVGGEDRLDRFVEIFEALGVFDLSLVVKFGVQFGLFGGAVLNLGSERHHLELLGATGKATLLGGFAMTERGHGSNVREVETVARYAPEPRRVRHSLA